MRLSALALVATLAAFAPSVRAEDAAEPEPASEIARRHLDAGAARYGAGDYRGALDEFLAARAGQPSRELEYDIARCHDRLGELTAALAAYEHYLEGQPLDFDPPARERVAEIRRQLHPGLERRPTSAPLARTAWGFFTVGAAALLAAVGTGVAAHAVHTDLEHTCGEARCPPSYADRVDLGSRLAITTDALLGVAGAATICTIIAGVVKRRHDHAVAVMPLASPRSGGLVVSVSR